MKLPLFQVDAFTSEPFSGNAAAIVPLDSWIETDLMQSIAMENQLSETAFFVASENSVELRWFTPKYEVDLCGHATLATAHVLFAEQNFAEETIVFSTRGGDLTVRRVGGYVSRYEMDFPIDPVNPDPEFLDTIASILEAPVKELWTGKEDWLAVVANEATVADLAPDLRALAALEKRGLLVTARGEEKDFVSRAFFPRYGIDEDPVTGSAHTTLTAYWSEQLGRSRFQARQISARGGDVECHRQGDRVFLRGDAVTFLRGEITL